MLAAHVVTAIDQLRKELDLADHHYYHAGVHRKHVAEIDELVRAPLVVDEKPVLHVEYRQK